MLPVAYPVRDGRTDPRASRALAGAAPRARPRLRRRLGLRRLALAGGFPDVPAALTNGAIAAGLLGEPLATLAEDQGQIVRLSEDFVNGMQVTAVYYSGDFLREHRKEAVGFLVAWLDASRDLFGNGYRRDEIAGILEKYTGVPAAVVKRARPPFHEPNGAMNLNDFARLQDFFRKRGELTYDKPLDSSTYIDLSVMRQALAIAGPFATR